MKAKEYFYFASLATVLTFGACCTSEEEHLGILPNNQNIEIGTYIQQQTRNEGKNSFESGDCIVLSACQTDGNYAGTFSANLMSNVEVSKEEDGTWSYSPLVVWPNDETKHISFAAFYPYCTTTNGLKCSFSVNDVISAQQDFMWCTVENACINDRNGIAVNGNEAEAAFEVTSGPLNLKFQHALSKINVSVKLSTDYSQFTPKLTHLSLHNVIGASTFTLADDLKSGVWDTNQPATSVYTLYMLDTESTEAAGIDLSEEVYTFDNMLLIPQNISGNGAYFSLTYTYVLEGEKKTVTQSISLPNLWEQNKVYNYVINLVLDVAVVEVMSSTSTWDDREENPSIGFSRAEPIDMGLSVKWASHDLGTTSAYVESPAFPWGAVNTTSSSGYNYTYSGTSYNHSYTLDAAHDTATKIWGGNWRMPTYSEWQALFNNSTITNVTLEGVEGYLVTSNITSNSIFLSGDYYWSSSYQYTGNPGGTKIHNYRYADLVKKAMSDYLITNSYKTRYPIRPVFD